MDNMYLVGSEDVQRAGNNISGAADTMMSAANNISSALDMFTQRMEDWVCRLEAIERSQ